MVDSTRLGDVVDERAARASELMVEDDAGGEAEEALKNAFSEALDGAGAVALECEELFAGPEDRFDPLADRRQVRTATGLVFAARANDGRAEFADCGGELASGVALVAKQSFAAGAWAAGQQF